MTEHTLPSGATISDVQKIYSAWETGKYTLVQMAEMFGYSQETIRRYTSRPEDYDPYIDEVAIVRAMDGDRAVFENLTVWERREFEMRISEIADGLDENSVPVPSAYMRTLSGKLGLAQDTLYRKYLKRKRSARDSVGRASAA